MSDIVFTNTDWNDLTALTEEYLGELGGKNDGFHNGMMYGAAPYKVSLDGADIGFFSLSDGWDGGKMLTSFYVASGKRRYSAEVLDRVVEEFGVTAALVTSNDANFVAVAFEKMNALGTAFNMQAYNHVYGKPDRPAEFGRDKLCEVAPGEYGEMNRLTEGQWEDCLDDPSIRFYAIRDNGETLGYGAIGRLIRDSKRADVGNFTLPQHRRKGVGRSMLICLGEIVTEMGLTPVAGCWHGNKESIPTLASSGFIPENRIFYVKFI